MKFLITEKSLLLLIVLFSLILRCWGIGDYEFFVGIENMHTRSAINYVENGQFKPDIWVHPPLRNLMRYLFIKIFGNNPYGWRMCNVLCGTLSVLFIFLITNEIFPDIRVAWTASILLAIDPLHITFSRTTFEEIYAALFFIICVYATIKYIKGNPNCSIIAGIFLGLAISTKWYYLTSAAAILFFTLYYNYKTGKEGFVPLGIMHIMTSYVVLPLSIYLLAFYPWFSRGYNLSEFLYEQIDSYSFLQSLKMTEYIRIIGESGSTIEWFIKPVIIGFIKKLNETRSIGLVYMNSLPVWILTWPSIVYLAYQTVKLKDLFMLLVLLLFITTYFQYLLSNRPIFLYSALVVMPFFIIAISFFISSLFRKIESLNKSPLYYRICMALIVIHGLYLYPLASAKTVPVYLYKFLLSFGKIRYGEF